METKIKKWGNSLAVRIPKDIAQKHSLEEGCGVVVVDSKEGVVVKRVLCHKLSFKEMVKKITKKNLHKEVDWGASQGKEIW